MKEKQAIGKITNMAFVYLIHTGLFNESFFDNNAHRGSC